MYGGKSTGLRWIGATVRTTYRPIVVIASAAFIVQPWNHVWLQEPNRVGILTRSVTGDVVTPEWMFGGRLVSWPDNRPHLGFKAAST